MREVIALLIGLVAGFAGSMLGVGGGFIVTPLLVFLVGLSMHQAVSTSLTSIVATSVSSTSVYSRENMTNFKLGLLLEITTVGGAITGSHVALLLPEAPLKILFGVVLAYASFRMLVGREEKREAKRKELNKRRLLLGMLASYFAGMFSGMLGIGGGTLKVPIMVLLLGLPVKEAIATSAFMVGLTASSAAIVYWAHGVYLPELAGAVIIGVFTGASIGARLALKVKGRILRKAFGVLLLFFSLRMLLSGVMEYT